jgi:hypothetical protein
MNTYEHIGDVVADLKKQGTDSRSIAIQYAVGRNIAIIDAQRISGTELVPSAVNPVGEVFSWTERHGGCVSFGARYVLSANGHLYLADDITIQPVIGQHSSDKHKFFGLINPSGEVKRKHAERETVKRLQESSSLVNILRDAHR